MEAPASLRGAWEEYESTIVGKEHADVDRLVYKSYFFGAMHAWEVMMGRLEPMLGDSESDLAYIVLGGVFDTAIEALEEIGAA